MDFGNLKALFVVSAMSVSFQSAYAQTAATAASEPSHPNPACRAGEFYVAAGNGETREGIASIFADEVDYTGPDGIKRRHHHEIAQVYGRARSTNVDMRRRVASAAPITPRSCLVEMYGSISGGPFLPNAVAHFEVNDNGKVIRFIPYILTSKAKWLAELFKEKPE